VGRSPAYVGFVTLLKRPNGADYDPTECLEHGQARYLKLSDGQVDFESLPQAFRDKVQLLDDGCWEWTGATVTSKKISYGQFRYQEKTCLAHRVSYEILVEKVPDGLELDHLCRNSLCVNPSHVEPVTHQENCQRGEAGLYEKLRTHCPAGHPYNAENTYWYKGGRNCRLCHNNSNKEYHLRKQVLDRTTVNYRQGTDTRRIFTPNVKNKAGSTGNDL